MRNENVNYSKIRSTVCARGVLFKFNLYKKKNVKREVRKQPEDREKTSSFQIILNFAASAEKDTHLSGHATLTHLDLYLERYFYAN